MKASRLELRTLRPEDEVSFRNAVVSFRAEDSSFEFAFGFDESEPFTEYVDKVDAWSKGNRLPENWVPNTFFVGVADGIIVGRLSLRHRLNDFLEKIGGHIGYGVVPRYRKQGYATEMVKQALPICSSLGINTVLITCDVDNVASRKVIERCGGVFESETNEPQLDVQKRRYRIRL